MTEYDPDTVTGGHDDRMEDEAHRKFDELAERQRRNDEFFADQKEADAIPVVGMRDRHVLIVEGNGLAYIATHELGMHDRQECERVANAWHKFKTPGEYEPNMEPGAYFCSVDSAGNFEPGGRVPQVQP